MIIVKNINIINVDPKGKEREIGKVNQKNKNNGYK